MPSMRARPAAADGTPLTSSSKSRPPFPVRRDEPAFRGAHHWKPALQLFQILFGEERVPVNG